MHVGRLVQILAYVGPETGFFLGAVMEKDNHGNHDGKVR